MSHQTASSEPAKRRAQRGSALLLVLVLTSLLAALIGTLAPQVMAEWRSVANHARADEVSLAAESAVQLVVEELGRAPSWTAVLAGTAGSSYGGGPLVVALAGGWSVDLAVEGTSLQSRSDDRTAGPDRPRWRLRAWGDLADLVPLRAPGPWPFVAVWVADDEVDGDGDPERDANDVLQVAALALGPGPERAWAAARVVRRSGTDVDVQAWYREP